MKKSTKKMGWHFYEHYYYIPKEDDIPGTLTSLIFETVESAELAQALYNSLVAADKYEPNEFRCLLRFINRMAGINPNWQ